jgi:hypothetical protein
LREELRIKDARMGRIPAHQRPHFEPADRLAILELRAARGWSVTQAARVFQLTACNQPRFEPRPAWPRGSPCARPRVLVKGQPGAQLALTVEFLDGRQHLPCITLTRDAA